MKAGFVYSLVLLGFIALVVFSNQPHRQKIRMHRSFGPGRRIVVRKFAVSHDAKHEPVAFDPIVAKYERRREDRAWEKEYFEQQYKHWEQNENADPNDPHHHQSSHSTHGASSHTANSHHEHPHAPHPESQPEPSSWDYVDPEDYLNNEDEFNISQRIVALFPMLDIRPPDGIISLSELQDWHLQAALNEAQHRTDRQMEAYDKNHDDMISFAEYLPHVSVEHLANDSGERGGTAWWKEHFDAADEDGNGLLNHTEFNNFLNPQDSHSERLYQWLRKQEIKDRDHDHDGKLSFSEFLSGLFDIIRNYDEEDHSLSHQSPDYAAKREALAKEKFAELDKNKDGFLTEDELTPVMDRLHPGEAYYAKQQAEYLMLQADVNKDGHLTLEEMLENPYIFYSTAYAHDDDDYLHEEF